MKTTGRGMVLEVEGDSALVLTPGGEFRWVPLDGQSRALGRDTTFTLPEFQARPRPALGPLLIPAVTAICVALLLLALVPGLGSPGPVAAYASVDINPSLELAMDGRGRVVQAEGLDAAGEVLLGVLGPLRGLPFEEALARLVGLAREQGFLSPEGHPMVVVAATPAGLAGEDLLASLEAWVRRVEERLRDEHGRPEGLVVATVQTEAAVREEARAMGLSAGRYAILLQAQAEGLELEVEDVRGKPLAEAIKAAGGSPGQVVAATAKETSLEALADKFRERNRALPPGLEKKLDENEDPGASPPAEPPGQAKEGGPPAEPPGQARKEDPAATPSGEDEGQGPVPPGQQDRDKQEDKDKDENRDKDKGRDKVDGETWIPPGQAKKDSRVR